MRLSRTLCLLVWLWLGCISALVGESVPDPRQEDLRGDERLETLLDRIRIEQQGLKTLEAQFVQLKESVLLLEPSEARGIFFYASPDRVRWEYESPSPISLLILGEEMTTWYHDLDQAEKVHVGSQSQRVLDYLGAGSSIDDLREYFSVKLAIPDDRSSPYRLELEPRYRRIARRLESMTVWIDAANYLPVRVRYIEPDGDMTEYSFHNFRINGELPEERFELQLPGSIEVKFVDLEGGAGLQ